MKVSRYTEWAYDLEDFSGFLWASTATESPEIVRVSETAHRYILERREAGGEIKFDKILYDAGIITDRPLDVNAVVQQNTSADAKSRELRRVVLVSASCPHGCWKQEYGGYCGQSHDKSYLNDSQINAIFNDVKSFLSTGNYNDISLGIFGAEPLTKIKSVSNLIEGFRDISVSYQINFKSSLVTSGLLLTKSRAFELFKAGLSNFEITLDGLAPSHDARRPTLAGSRTFDKIYKNLIDISNFSELDDLSGTIRMNVDSRNQNDVLPLFKELRSAGLWPRFNFYISRIRDWGIARAGSLFDQEEEFSRIEIKLLREQLIYGGNIRLLPPRKTIACTAVRSSSSVWDPYGIEHKCTETPLSPAEMPSKMKDTQATTWGDEWKSMILSHAVPCTKCNFLPACGGSCPKDWMLGRTPCPTFKTNMKQRMQLTSLFHGGKQCSMIKD